jgi:hypothetical protein
LRGNRTRFNQVPRFADLEIAKRRGFGNLRAAMGCAIGDLRRLR